MSMQKVKVRGQRSMSQRSVWIHIWRWNGAQSLMLLRRGAFQDHPSNFKVTRLKQLSILTQIGSLGTVTPVWIHQWLWNDAQIMKQHKRCALLFFKVNHRFSQSHGTKKITNFDPNCAFPDCNSSLNVPMALKCYIKLNVVKKRCPIVFQGHPSNFNVTRYKKSPILTRIERFWAVIQVWLHWWIWNDAQSLM